MEKIIHVGAGVIVTSWLIGIITYIDGKQMYVLLILSVLAIILFLRRRRIL